MTNKPTELVVTQALLPCPLCDGPAEYTWNQLYSDNTIATCRSCGCSAFYKKWNTRLAPTAPASDMAGDELPTIEALQRPIAEAANILGIYMRASDAEMLARAVRAHLLAALRPRSEWEEIVAWLRDMPPDYEYARAFATMIENTYTKDKDKKSTLHTAAVEERVRIANWLREDAPQWGHEALADAIERGDFKEGTLK